MEIGGGSNMKKIIILRFNINNVLEIIK